MQRRRQHRSRRGSAIVEFALAVPLLFLIFGATFEFGYTFYIYNRLQSTVRGAARYGALREYVGLSGSPATTYLTAVKNFAVSGDPNTATPPLVPELTSANIDVQITMSSGLPQVVTVAITGYRINAIFKSYLLTGKPAAAFRYAGRIASL